MSIFSKKKPEQQRFELEKSQRNATKETPQNFRDEANDDKLVEVGGDMTEAPIQGIDPAERGKKER